MSIEFKEQITMTFQRARNDEQRQIRINQITTAMIELMEDLPFDKITMKKLGEKLSFTRNNLYQYVKSKNEVILLIIQQDFIDWANSLHDNLQPLKTPTLSAFCKVWVQAAVSDNFTKIVFNDGRSEKVESGQLVHGSKQNMD